MVAVIIKAVGQFTLFMVSSLMRVGCLNKWMLVYSAYLFLEVNKMIVMRLLTDQSEGRGLLREVVWWVDDCHIRNQY